jgi:hypothetical protein
MRGTGLIEADTWIVTSAVIGDGAVTVGAGVPGRDYRE